jgi:hypothetical protein
LDKIKLDWKDDAIGATRKNSTINQILFAQRIDSIKAAGCRKIKIPFQFSSRRSLRARRTSDLSAWNVRRRTQSSKPLGRGA